jgi:predicted amidohydrolase YtcJ
MFTMMVNHQEHRYVYKKGIYKTDNLDVRSFKMYGDGALGSRGACLHKSYSDMQSTGALLLPTNEICCAANSKL